MFCRLIFLFALFYLCTKFQASQGAMPWKRIGLAMYGQRTVTLEREPNQNDHIRRLLMVPLETNDNGWREVEFGRRIV